MTQRLSISRKSEQDSMFQLAVRNGYSLANYREGEFRTYLEKLEKKGKFTTVKIYSNKVFIHRNNSLITVYEVPRKYGNSDSYLHYAFIKRKLIKNLERKYDNELKFKDVSKIFDKREDCFVYSLSSGETILSYGIGDCPDTAMIDAMNRVVSERSRIEVK